MRFARPSILLALVSVAGVSCSSAGPELSSPTGAPSTTTAPVSPASSASSTSPPTPTEIAVTTTVAAATSSTGPATVPPVASTAATAVTAGAAPKADPPATGVPGAESADAFCLAYGSFSSSTYLVGLAEAYSPDPLVPRRLEVVGATSIAASFQAALDALPAALAGERGAFEERWGGYATRLTDVLAAIPSTSLAGATLPDVWNELLATHDRNDPNVALDLPAAAVAELDGLAARLSGSYATDARIGAGAEVPTPAVDEYVAGACPDVAASTVGDAV